MTHNTTLAVNNHFYYGIESLFLYKKMLLKTNSETQRSGIFRFVDYASYTSKDIQMYALQ